MLCQLFFTVDNITICVMVLKKSWKMPNSKVLAMLKLAVNGCGGV